MPAVTYESRDRIAIVTIDRPEKKSSLGKEVVNELNGAWVRFSGSRGQAARCPGRVRRPRRSRLGV